MRAAPVLFAVVMMGWAIVASGQRLVPGADPKHQRIKYADSLVSLNDKCAVAKNRLNLKVRPVYVNGQPVGFC